MEVHHHTHTNPAHRETSRKKFTHYIWEFLMLFLAVFCGFLAENFREHLIDHRREIQYMKSMLSDLSNDTTQLGMQEETLIERWTACDSISYYLKSGNIKNFGSEIYYYGRIIGFYNYRRSLASRTLDQLKSAGMFRLIQDLIVADSILKYDEEKKEYETSIAKLFDEIKNIQQVNKLLFDTKIFEAATEYTSRFNYKPLKPLGNPVLLNYETNFLQRYYNDVYYLKRITEGCLRSLYNCRQMNKSLAETIEKEYHLK